MKSSITFLISFLLASGLSAGDSSLSTIDPASLVFKRIIAVRTAVPPRIDGELTDPVWLDAVPITDFHQIDPMDLGVPTERQRFAFSTMMIIFMSVSAVSMKILRRL